MTTPHTHEWVTDESDLDDQQCWTTIQHCACKAVREIYVSESGRKTIIFEPGLHSGIAKCRRCKGDFVLCIECRKNTDPQVLRDYVCRHCCAAKTCTRLIDPNPVREEELL
jgi:hypothetical protein